MEIHLNDVMLLSHKSIVLKSLELLTISSLSKFIYNKNSIYRLLIHNGHCPDKTSLQWFANNKGADQPASMRSLISAFIIHVLESIIYGLPSSEISIF